MSKSHTRRRKLIKSLKKNRFNWYPVFRKQCDKIREANMGPCLGTIEELLALKSNESIKPAQ